MTNSRSSACGGGPHRAPGRSLRVLVVDDSRDMADATCMMLRLWGHNVRSAYGGATGLLLASDILPDVILLDVAMPTVTGCDVAQQLRRLPRFNRTSIFAMSGYVDEIHRQKFQQAGFDDLLPKPLELDKLEKLFECERERVQRPRITARVRGYTTTEAPPRRLAPWAN